MRERENNRVSGEREFLYQSDLRFAAISGLKPGGPSQTFPERSNLLRTPDHTAVPPYRLLTAA